jgi:hypothetical protein
LIVRAAYSDSIDKETDMGKDIYTADDALDLSRAWHEVGGNREGLRAWLEKEQPHLLRSYDADFLVNAVEAARTQTAPAR